MIIENSILKFVHSGQYIYDGDLQIRSDGGSTKDTATLLDNAHARIFIDTLSPLAGGGNLMQFQNLIAPLNAIWTTNANNDGVITPNVIRQQLGIGVAPGLGVNPLSDFLYNLRYNYRGCFKWAAGTSVAFRNWLANPAPGAVIQLRAEINCWEFVLYVAIISGLVPKATIVTAYTQLQPGEACLNALHRQSVAAHLGGRTQREIAHPLENHQAGDIIFVPEHKNAEGDARAEHVFVILELDPNRVFLQHKVMSLWSHCAGGISEIVSVEDLVGFNKGFERYFTVRVG